jgi:FkbM family methyltransferase
MVGHLPGFARQVGVKQVTARPPGTSPYPFFVHEKDDAFISNRIARTGVWEPFESTMMLGLLKPLDQFIDVGANIGWYALAAAARVGAGGHVIAIEPDSDNFKLLEANVAQNSSVSITPFRCAVGSAQGRGIMSASRTNKGDQRVRNSVDGTQPAHSADTVRIETLDSLLERTERFDIDRLRVIKIDVQGFEADVLKGAAQLLSRLPARVLIFLEFEPSLLRDNSPSSCQDLIDLVASIRRDVFQICRPLRRVRRLAVSDLVDFEQAGNASADLIIAHHSQVGDLRSTLPMIPRLLSHREWRRRDQR